MNKFLIVGHDSSYSKEVGKALKAYGLGNLTKSMKYEYTGQKVVSKIISSYELNHNSESVDDIESVLASDLSGYSKYGKESIFDYSQIKPQKMWDHLLFDLYIANSHQKNWVWQDNQAVRLLDYLAVFDEQLFFVLVYDKPQNVLLDMLHEDLNLIDENTIYERLKDWLEYNKVLLRFKRENTYRCLLVNGLSSLNSIELLTGKLGQQSHLHFTNDVSQNYEKCNQLVDTNRDVSHLVDVFISKNIDILKFFNELELEADLSDALEIEENLDITTKDILSALRSYQVTKELNTLRKDDIKLVSEIASLESKSNDIPTTSQDHYNYNVILSQMHILQSDMESLYLENLRLNNEQRSDTQIGESIALQASPEMIKSSIAYRIGNKIIKSSKEPLTVLSVSRDVLKEYKSHKNLIDNKKLREVSCYQDTEETKKIKNHLSFQIGEVVVESIESPVRLLILPVRLVNRMVKFKLKNK